MVEGLKPTAEAEGNAYSGAFDLHRHIYAAIDAMRSMLGDEFVTLYTALKDAEYGEFQGIITPYERETLMFNV
jgi:glutamine synthetase